MCNHNYRLEIGNTFVYDRLEDFHLTKTYVYELTKIKRQKMGGEIRKFILLLLAVSVLLNMYQYIKLNGNNLTNVMFQCY